MATIYQRKSIVSQDNRLNVFMQTLHDFGPKDAIEARLTVQAESLFLYGMKCLKESETADMMCHGEYHANKAVKLLRLHNETIEALNVIDEAENKELLSNTT